MIVAKINKEYALRMAGVALLMLGICLWSIYDGLVAWPRINQEFERVRPALLGTNLTAKAWLARTGEEGLSELELRFSEYNLKPPSRVVKGINEAKMPSSVPEGAVMQAREQEQQALKKIFEGDVYGQHDLQGQFVMAAITALAALAVFFSFIGKISRRYIADERGLTGSGFGEGMINYADIESIDWKQWDKKGIIRLTLKDGNCHKLDGWHFAGITPVVDEIVRQRPELAQVVDSKGCEPEAGQG
ncbi:MAG: hypothetical protein PHO37_18430 [Kiritimatiellae bacterium]|nr:hypothetical protein [Kiritimatiellia bacterium]